MTATEDGNEISVELGTLNPDEQTTVEIVVTADEPGLWVNQATATSAEGATDSSEATTTVVQPMLEIAKDGRATALLNTDFDYTITVTNIGDGEATGTTVIDTLPSGLEAVSSDREGGKIIGSTVRWDIGTISAGASETIIFTVKGVAGGDQENVVTASTDGSSISPEARATTTILVPDISITKSGRSAMFVGNEATFTLTVSNTGEAPLTDVTITEDIASGMSYVSSSPEGTVSADGSQVVWNIGTLALEGEVSVSVTLQADEEGTITNTASTSATEDVSDSASIDVLVLPAAGAHIQITDSSDPVRVGETVDYTVLVDNQGRSAMTGVSVTVAIPDAMTVTSTSSDQAVMSEDGSTVTFELSDPLAAGDNFSFSSRSKPTSCPKARTEWTRLPPLRSRTMSSPSRYARTRARRLSRSSGPHHQAQTSRRQSVDCRRLCFFCQRAPESIHQPRLRCELPSAGADRTSAFPAPADRTSLSTSTVHGLRHTQDKSGAWMVGGGASGIRTSNTCPPGPIRQGHVVVARILRPRALTEGLRSDPRARRRTCSFRARVPFS